MAKIGLQVHIIIQILVIMIRHAHLSMAFFLSKAQGWSTTRLPDVYHKTPGSRCVPTVPGGFSLPVFLIGLPNVYQYNFFLLILLFFIEIKC